MFKSVLLSSTLLVVLLTSVSCKKEKEEEEETTPANKKPTVTVAAQFDVTIAARTQAPALYYILASAEAADEDGSISKVEFYNNGSLVGEDTTSPYTLSFNSGSTTNTIYAVAYDNDNDSTQSASVQLDVNP